MVLKFNRYELDPAAYQLREERKAGPAGAVADRGPVCSL